MNRKGIIAGLSLGLALVVGLSVGRAADASATPAKAGAYPVHSVQTMPAALQPAFYQALARDAGAVYAVNKAGCASLPDRKLSACFNEAGARFTGAGAPLALHLNAYGRGDRLAAVNSVKPTMQGNGVRYAHGNLSEWWRVLPLGFEQGFTIAKRPAGRGELVLALAASRQDAGADSTRHSRAGGDSLNHTLAWGKLRYGRLVVTDANGKVVPATLKSKGDRILIAVNDVYAAYPLTVDPLVWIEQQVTGSDSGSEDFFGNAVAISGTMAIVGASEATVNGNDQQGAAYIFSDEDGVWVQTAKLTASDGQAEDFFGYSVALDGDTALVGAWDRYVSRVDGGAYVFKKANGSWMQVAKLAPGDQSAADSWFGYAVALAGPNMALVGAPSADYSEDAPYTGAVYAFTDAEGNWTQTQKFKGNETVYADYFGNAVAASGTTALIGEYHADNGGFEQGDAYIFTESNGIWAETQRLIANDGQAYDLFGSSVAIDGVTALIGASGVAVNGVDDSGAVYVFDGSGGSWTQAQKLVGQQGPEDQESAIQFGFSISLDGTTAVIGAPDDSVGTGNGEQGTAYVFNESNGAWTLARRLHASNPMFPDAFGHGVAFAGNTALIGADGKDINGNAKQGAAFFFGRVNDLRLAVSAPQTVGQGQDYVSQTIATNNASASSPAITAKMPVPAAASYVSATATQGSCSENNDVVTCDFGPIAGDAGTATANVTLKATGAPGTTIENTARIAKATPPLTASAATMISGGGGCPAGYSEYDGNLAAHHVAQIVSYQAAAGKENAILSAPAGFQLYVRTVIGGKRTLHRVRGNEIHRHGPAGTYIWGAKAGNTAGSYTFCVKHP